MFGLWTEGMTLSEEGQRYTTILRIPNFGSVARLAIP